MGYITTLYTEAEFSVHSDDFDTDDVCKFIKGTLKKKSGKARLEAERKFLIAIGSIEGRIGESASLLDEMKMEVAQKIADACTLQELEELKKQVGV